MEMHGQITEIDGTEEPEDIWTPICMEYLLTCFFPNNKTEPYDRRFLRSLATGYDMMLKGHNFMAMDFFMSRNLAATIRLTEPSPSPLLSEADANGIGLPY